MNYRHMMRPFLAAILFAMATVVLLAEPSVDPNDAVYDDLEVWEVAGYLETPLPLFQPYPHHVLTTLLEEVTRHGDATARRDAARYLDRIGGETRVEPWTRVNGWFRDDEVQPWGSAGADFSVPVTNRFEIAGSAGGFLIERGAQDLLPGGQRTPLDVMEDNAKVEVAGRTIYTLLNLDSQSTVYAGPLTVQAGILRRSFGEFREESPVMSASARQSANFIVDWPGEVFSYTAAVVGMTAYQRFRSPEEPGVVEDVVDVTGVGYTDGQLFLYDKPDSVAGKIMYLHALRIAPWSWLRFTLFESTVAGPRVEPAYLVPLKFMWHAQGTTGFGDNSFLGLTASVAPATRWRVPLTIYVDDAGFNDIARLKLDTKYKIAASGAVQWAPRSRFVPRLQVGYEAVTPYMYTHAYENPYTDDPNNLNYLHQGTSLGNGLLPNSDRTTVRAWFRPVDRVVLETRAAVLRHGNASDGELDQYLNDGGYEDNGREGEFVTRDFDGDGVVETLWVPGDLTFNHDLRFLDQSDIETHYQAGATATWTPSSGSLDFAVRIGYTFEYVENPLSYVWDGTATDGGGGTTVAGSDRTDHYAEVFVEVRY